MINIAIFASGSGTNAENIISHFSNSNTVSVKQILCNKSDAYVVQRAKIHNIDCKVFKSSDLKNSDAVLNSLVEHKIDYIVLAGFLLLMPESIINMYDGRIVNIHPALLPKFGGKGMYGDNVHKAVVENKEEISGITIHHVNKNFDDGDIIFQATVELQPCDTPEIVAQKIHELEQAHFPKVIESELKRIFNK